MTDLESTAVRRAIDEIGLWSAELGSSLTADQLEKLAVYFRTLLAWNRAFALVSRQDVPTIAAKHFADSLVAAFACPTEGSVADLGSGAGFPGLVIAIVRPLVQVRLFESRGKKVNFLREVIRLLELANAEARQERVEAPRRASEREGEHDLTIARAFGSLDEFLTLSRPLLRDRGVALAMKGPSHADELEGLDLAAAGFALESVREYVLPDSSRRALLRFCRR